jgi:hypothetical protein
LKIISPVNSFSLIRGDFMKNDLIYSVIQLALILIISVNSANSVSTDLREIPASEIRDMIEKGIPVGYDHIIVMGDLNISQLDLPTMHSKTTWYEREGLSLSKNATLVNSSIRLNDSVIEGSLCLNNAIFESSINFNDTKFNRPVYFGGSKFNGPACFLASEFNEPISFRYSQFNEPVNFGYSKFNEGADFRNTTFNRLVDFRGSAFDGPTSFIHSEFNGPANFWYSKFNKTVDFLDSNFGGSADFWGSKFNGPVDFSYSRFNGHALFNEARFFESLDLTQVTFSRLDIYWPDIKRLICEDDPTYLSLIKNFKDLGQTEAADDIYFQYRKWSQAQKPLSDGSKYFDILAFYTCGYGVRPGCTVFSGIIVLVFFGLIYHLIVRSYISSNIIESLCFSAIILLSAPKELFPLSHKSYYDHMRYIKRLQLINFLPILERLIGWGLMLLLIGTLSRVMIRY